MQPIKEDSKYRRTITLELPETTQFPPGKYQIPKMIKTLEELLPDILSLQDSSTTALPFFQYS